MGPAAKKLSADAVAQAFAQADQGPPLSDDDRAALLEAAADPKWVRMSRGAAFERLVCDDDDGE